MTKFCYESFVVPGVPFKMVRIPEANELKPSGSLLVMDFVLEHLLYLYWACAIDYDVLVSVLDRLKVSYVKPKCGFFWPGGGALVSCKR